MLTSLEQGRTLNPFETRKYRDNLATTFLSFYEGLGSTFVPPIPLVPGKIDTSVVFTGATINGWKEYLRSEKELAEGGIHTVQPCLRTQNADSFYRIENIPPFGSYFTMAGILAPSSRLDEIYRSALNFLMEKIRIRPKNITVHLCSMHEEIGRCVDNNTPSGVYIARDQINYYEWRYGMEGFRGEGLTIAIFNETTGMFEEIGNVVLIKRDGAPVASEWGFGLETATARILSLPHPLCASPVARAVGENFLETPVGVRLADGLLVVSALLANGIDFSYNDRRVVRVLEDYKRGVGFLASLKGMSGEEIIEIIKETAGLISPGVEISEKVIDRLLKYISHANERREGFLNSVQGFLRNPSYRENPYKLQGTLRNTASNFGFNSLACLALIRYNRKLFTSEEFEFLLKIWEQNQ